MIPEEDHWRGRLIFAKIFGIGTFMDDTFDVHATLEESRSLNEAFQRYVNKGSSSFIFKLLRSEKWLRIYNCQLENEEINLFLRNI
jgi:hypothetical protein